MDFAGELPLDPRYGFLSRRAEKLGLIEILRDFRRIIQRASNAKTGPPVPNPGHGAFLVLLGHQQERHAEPLSPAFLSKAVYGASMT